MQGCYWSTFLSSSSSHDRLFGTTVSKICKKLAGLGSEGCNYKKVSQQARTELKPDSPNQKSQLPLRSAQVQSGRRD